MNRTVLYIIIFFETFLYGSSLIYSQDDAGVKAYSAASMVNVYDKTYRGFDIVAELQYGEKVEILSEKGEWAYILYADKYKGWTRLENLSLTVPPEIVDLFSKVLNSPSKWFPPPFKVIGWENSRRWVGNNFTVEGNIERIVITPKYYYLYMDPVGEKFRAVISVKDAPEFPYPLDSFFLYRQVRVSGLLKYTFYGAEIVLIYPNQIDRAYSSAPKTE